MQTKPTWYEPDNSYLDAFAMQYGEAIWMKSEDGMHIVVSTTEEMNDLKRQGWRVKGNISFSDFQGSMGGY
jgi:hypothetical protein